MGVCFMQGVWVSPTGEQKVVLKRVKTKVEVRRKKFDSGADLANGRLVTTMGRS